MRGVQREHRCIGACTRGHDLMTAEQDQEPQHRFRNHYECGRCGHTWTDDWSCMCDDDCPECGARHMSPFKSEDLPGVSP